MRSGYIGFAVALAAGAGAEYLVYWFWLAHPPVTDADRWAFVFFQALPLIFWLAGGLPALARTRRTWGREIRGSVYSDHRSLLFGPKRYDLARVRKAQVTGGNDEYSDFFQLALMLPEPGTGASIKLPVSTEEPDACTGQARVFVLALADALAEHPRPEVTEQAVADLRFLATASGQEAHAWLADLMRRRGFRARRQRRRQEQQQHELGLDDDAAGDES